jgi:uncharacterized protein (DUF2252 family)
LSDPVFDVKDPLLSPQPRPLWVADQIHSFNRRLPRRSRKEKFTEMARSSFDFFRGAAHLYWADFGESNLLGVFGGKKGTRTWICGDLHSGHFGSFTDAMGWLVLDINNFDEGVVADFQFDLWRLGISLVLGGRHNQLAPKETHKLVESFTKGYYRELKRCDWYPTASHGRLDEDAAFGQLRHFLSQVKKENGPEKMLERWTEQIKGKRRFRAKGNPDLGSLPEGIRPQLTRALKQYGKELRPWPLNGGRLFEIQDLACRLHAGAGSHDMNRYYALVLVEEEGKEHHCILDIKFQPKPACWAYLPKKSRQKTKSLCKGNHALRTVLAAKALGRHMDPWLGWLELSDGEYSVRERSPYRAILPLEKLDAETARQLGEITARAHARARNKFPSKVLKRLKGRKNEFHEMMQAVCRAYADQVEMDYQGFRKEMAPPIEKNRKTLKIA